jgi:hypothetical protein
MVINPARIDHPKTASGHKSSFSLTRQAQTNRYDRRISQTFALSLQVTAILHAACGRPLLAGGSQCARHKMSALLLPLDHVQLRALTQAGALDQESGPFEAGSLWTDRATVVLCVRRPG